MDDERPGSGPGRGQPDVEASSQIETAELDREWASRRLDVYRGLDTAVQQAIANVLTAAAETRQAMELEAKGVLDRLRHERSRLVEDIREYRRQREGLATELGESRRRAEEEVTRLRRAAETERAQMLRDAESRKAELNGEIQRLEQQLADVSSGIQSLLQEQIGRFRGEIPGPTQRGRGAEPPADRPRGASTSSPRPSRGTEALSEAAASLSAANSIDAPAVAPRASATPPSGPAAPAAPVARSEPGAGGSSPMAPSPSESTTADSRAASGRPPAQVANEASRTLERPETATVEGRLTESSPPARPPSAPTARPEGAEVRSRPAPDAPPPVATPRMAAGAYASAAQPPPEVAREAPPRAAAPDVAPASAPPAPASAAPLEPPSTLARTEVSVTNTPSFARALELQRAVQRSDGVRQVQALQFERGTLVLSVEHDPDLDLIEAISGIGNLGLEVTQRAEGRVVLNFPTA